MILGSYHLCPPAGQSEKLNSARNIIKTVIEDHPGLIVAAPDMSERWPLHDRAILGSLNNDDGPNALVE
jgi:hypothetical protein